MSPFVDWQRRRSTARHHESAARSLNTGVMFRQEVHRAQAKWTCVAKWLSAVLGAACGFGTIVILLCVTVLTRSSVSSGPRSGSSKDMGR